MGGDEAVVQTRREFHALRRGRERELDVSGHGRRERAIEELPREPLEVVQHASRVDRVVEDPGGLGDPALHPQCGAQHREDEREELALTGRAPDCQRAFGVAPGGLEAVGVHLGGREVHEAVEAASDVLVGQAVDALRGFVAQPLGLGHRADHGGGERLHRECRRR